MYFHFDAESFAWKKNVLKTAAHMCAQIDLIEQPLRSFQMCLTIFRLLSISFRPGCLSSRLNKHWNRIVKCIRWWNNEVQEKRPGRTEKQTETESARCTHRRDALTRKWDSFDSSRFSLRLLLSMMFWRFCAPAALTTWLCLINKAASNQIYRQYFIYGIIVKK